MKTPRVVAGVRPLIWGLIALIMVVSCVLSTAEVAYLLGQRAAAPQGTLTIPADAVDGVARNHTALPLPVNATGELWITEEDAHGWVSVDGLWLDVGKVVTTMPRPTTAGPPGTYGMGRSRM